MSPNPLQEKFDKARKDYNTARETKLLGLALGALRDAVKDMQENGMPAALQVRPGSQELDTDKSLPVLANGTLRLNELDIPFVVAKPESGTVDYLHIHLSRGTSRRTVWARETNPDMKDQILTGIFRIHAENEFAESFNVGTTGISRMTLDKFPAPKLPKP